MLTYGSTVQIWMNALTGIKHVTLQRMNTRLGAVPVDFGRLGGVWAVLLCVLGLLCSGGAVAQDRSGVDQTACGLEFFYTARAKNAIINPNAAPDSGLPGLGSDEFTTPDGNRIRGLYWQAENPRGYALIAPGTSMLAAEIYRQFEFLRYMGLDVYIYDYRGMGRSEGKTTLNAAVADVRQAIDRLNANEAYNIRVLYGLSFGGIAILNAVGGRQDSYDGLILDSVPNTIPWYLFCPYTFDPGQFIPASCTNWLVIAAVDDPVIGGRGEALAESAAVCGANVEISEAFGHVFMDSPSNTQQRLGMAKEFLTEVIEATVAKGS